MGVRAIPWLCGGFGYGINAFVSGRALIIFFVYFLRYFGVRFAGCSILMFYSPFSPLDSVPF